MISKNQFLFFFFLVSILIIASCHKENTPQKSKVELLTGTRWQFDRLLYEKPPGSIPSDFSTAIFLPCELDDIFQFKQDGSFVSNENTIICNPPTNGFLTAFNGGGWSLSQGDTLAIMAGLNKQMFLLTNISTSALELKQTMKDYFQEEFTYRFQFKATP